MNLNFLNVFSSKFLQSSSDAKTLRDLETRNNSLGKDEDQINWNSLAAGLNGAYGYTDFEDSLGNNNTSMIFEGVFNDKRERISFYRSMYNYPLVKKAITMMTDEMCKPNADNEVASFNINKAYIQDFTNAEYQALKHEFDYVINCVFGSDAIYDLLRRWLIDGEQFIENCASSSGDKLVGIKVLPPYTSLVVYREGVAEGYIQDTSSIDPGSRGRVQEDYIKRFNLDQISYSDYGTWGSNRNDIRGHLDPAIRPLNQLRSIEDALVVTRINRAPERRLWNVYVGRTNDAKANQILNDVKNKYRKTLSIDPTTGMIESSKNIQSFTEDIFVAKNDSGLGTTIEPIKSSTEFNGQMDDVKMFQQQVMDALLVPSSRWAADGETQYSLAPEQQLSEVTFQEMCRRLAQKYCNQIIKHTFIVHLKLAKFKDKYLDPAVYNISLHGANNFEKIRELGVWEKMSGILGQLQTMLPNLGNSRPDSEEPHPLISRRFLYEKILHMNDADIQMNERSLEEEKNRILTTAEEAGSDFSEDEE